MNKERLLKLANFLDELPPERFNFGQWVDGTWEGKPDLSCGTTACAIGWATTMPEFRALGLRLKRVVDHPTARVVTAGYPILRDKSRHERKNASIAEEVFGISEQDYTHLFYPDVSIELGNTATPKQVAEHIRNFVNA